MKKVNFDNFTDNYNELLGQQTAFFSADEAYFAHYKVLIVRRIIKGQPSRILEYGCGIGRNIPFLVDAFKSSEIMGSDISIKSLEMARNANPGIYFWQEGDRQTECSNFDLIFVAGVFHHIPPAERVKATQTLFNRLAPNGSVVIFEHNPYNPITRKIVNNCPYDQDAILLKPSELRRHLKYVGLDIQAQGYTLFFPPRLKHLLFLEDYLCWLPLGGQYWVVAIKV